MPRATAGAVLVCEVSLSRIGPHGSTMVCGQPLAGFGRLSADLVVVGTGLGFDGSRSGHEYELRFSGSKFLNKSEYFSMHFVLTTMILLRCPRFEANLLRVQLLNLLT